MYREKIKEILSDVKNGKTSLKGALRRLENLPYEDLGFANIDHHRVLRKGFPEVVYCERKKPSEAAEIILRLSKKGDVLATRASKRVYTLVKKRVRNAEYNEVSKTIVVRNGSYEGRKGRGKGILVISAGTSDIPVAEEAAVTAEVMGSRVERLFDVGVAGIHRLFGNRERLKRANVLIVVAGMDGVLPSVVSGLVGRPLIAVPTSVGYGASFQGIGPLLTMLNSCAPGIVVVNIDNGFGAGYFASLIDR
ncbi:MAG TPA: nickel pincer cofactor biosynthesis protein LarB [Thermodesulfobacteriota bacterium]|nr:nickel pincer cofactor biosynthesis protein LarB [Thermodesulfobacteriota bacterium]